MGESLGRVRLVFGAGGRARTARQRKSLAFIERADAALVETGLLDLQVGAVQRSAGNSSIAKRTASAAVPKRR